MENRYSGLHCPCSHNVKVNIYLYFLSPHNIYQMMHVGKCHRFVQRTKEWSGRKGNEPQEEIPSLLPAINLQR